MTRYPNGSVPYNPYSDFRPESLALRAKRIVCAMLNHHPRRYGGSWCMGYGYVCGRCYMFADPLPEAQVKQMWDTLILLSRLSPEEQQMAAARMSGGGPTKGRAE